MTKLANSRWRWVILALVAAAAIVAGVIGSFRPSADVVLTDLHSVNELRELFNQDKGATRILLLLSPT
jgi:hypothetical protein